MFIFYNSKNEERSLILTVQFVNQLIFAGRSKNSLSNYPQYWLNNQSVNAWLINSEQNLEICWNIKKH